MIHSTRIVDDSAEHAEVLELIDQARQALTLPGLDPLVAIRSARQALRTADQALTWLLPE
ncbi:hypothetical protein J5X84_30900 [Streptosporangiaceae bacterium NEAU-GS5]|nr:hypothetical protein [Streptosporangiaceae bacterium NEAU-GS5]